MLNNLSYAPTMAGLTYHFKACPRHAPSTLGFNLWISNAMR